MSKRYRNQSTRRNKKSFVAILFNKWTLLALLFILVIILSLFAAKLTTSRNAAHKQELIEEKDKKEAQKIKTAFKQYKENMKPRLDFSKLNKSEFPELETEILSSIETAGFGGSVLAIKDNKLIVNSAVGYSDKKNNVKLTKDSDYMIASIQKSFTAVAIMRLVEDNLLTLYTPLSQFFPEIPNSDYITIRNLLDMTSGLFVADHDKTALDEEGVLNELIPNIYYQPLYNGWQYSAVNYNILAGIIRKVSGESYEDYVTNQILIPLNLEHTGFYTERLKKRDATLSYTSKSIQEPYKKQMKISEQIYASEVGTGNIYTTTSDLMTYFQGVLDGHVLRKNNLVQLMTHDLMYFNYTYASGVYDRNDHILAHGMFMGFEPTVVLSKDGSTGIIFLSNTFNTDNKSKVLIERLYEKIKHNDLEQNVEFDPNQQINEAPLEPYDAENYQVTGEDQSYY